MNGNTRTTRRCGLSQEDRSTYGKARRVSVMDRGVPGEAILKGTARAEATDFLSGGHAQEQNQRAGSAVAKGARFGEGEALPA